MFTYLFSEISEQDAKMLTNPWTDPQVAELSRQLCLLTKKRQMMINAIMGVREQIKDLGAKKIYRSIKIQK